MLKYRKLSSAITVIEGITGELMYVVEGSDRALLIDTGVGLGSLKETVSSVTDKPVTVLLTHGHVDHAMGASEFDEVYMNHRDKSIFEDHCRLSRRIEYIKLMRPDLSEHLDAAQLLKPAESFKDVSDQSVFQLGGMTARVLELPGHTPGSVAVLLEQERVLLTGDACNSATLVNFEGGPSIEEYRDNLLKFKAKTSGRFDRILLSHGDPEAPVSVIDTVLEVCDEILTGKDEAVVSEFMGNVSWIAHAMEWGKGRLDGKFGNIIYNKNNIYKKL